MAAELRLADERAEHMESRADALDELVEIGVLGSYAPTRDLSATSDDSADSVETLLEQIRRESESGSCASVDAYGL